MSSIALFDAQLVIARLAAQVTAFKQVAGSADFATATDHLKATPSAFVVELTNQSASSQTVGLVSQNLTIRFGVMIAAQNVADQRGEQAAATMRPLREAVMAALLGWAPGADYDVCEFSAGRLMGFENMALWWQDDYVTRILQRS